MAKHKANTVRLGIFIVAALVIFTYALYRIGDQEILLRNSTELYVDFKDVKGLRPGNNVRFSGIVVGSVQEITILNDTTLRVKMALDAGVKDFLRKNAEAEVASDGLVGNMVVDIRPGKEQADLVKNGDLLCTRNKVDYDEVLDQLASTNEKISGITEHLLAITQKMNEGTGSISLLINDAEMAGNLKTAANNLQVMSGKMRTAGNELADALQLVAQGEGNLGYLLRDTSLETQMADLSSSLDTLIAVRTAPIMDSLEVAAASLATSSRAVEELLTSMDNDQGVFGAIMQDSSITQDLRTTIQNIEAGTQKFDENMKALRASWPFKRYFKKRAKKERP